MEEKCCYHCSRPEHFIHNCPLIKTLRENDSVKWLGWDSIKEGNTDPSNNSQHFKEPPDSCSQCLKATPTDSLVESKPLSFLAWG